VINENLVRHCMNSKLVVNVLIFVLFAMASAGKVFGGRVYFERLDENRQKRIVSVDRNGGDEMELLVNLPSNDEFHLCSVSPDGEFVSFHTLKDSQPVAYVIKSDGSELKCLGDGVPVFFSPDSLSVVIESENVEHLSVVDVSTGKALASWDLPEDFEAIQFSSNGENLLVVDDEEGEMCLVDAKTGQIVDDEIEPQGVFSPDGAKLFWWARGRGRNFYVANSDGSNRQELDGCAFNTAPIWSSDSKSLLAVESLGNAKYSLQILEFNNERSKIVGIKKIAETDSLNIAW
jgi:Tol biopolymer transport system component